jgi:hypothetical protein
MFRRTAMVWAPLTAALALAAMPVVARAQTSGDVFGVNYYANANTSAVTADAAVRITNPGTNGGTSPAGDLCALIYVFSADQQLAECCGCRVTPNGLRTLSVNGDLTSNPLTPVTLTTGAIKIVSSTPSSSGACDASSPTPTPELLSWATHVQRPSSSSSGVVTETAFQGATLSTTELSVLQDKCSDIIDNGSGHGICACGQEPQD